MRPQHIDGSVSSKKGRVRLKLTMPTSDGLNRELPASFHTLSRDGDSTPLRPLI